VISHGSLVDERSLRKVPRSRWDDELLRAMQSKLFSRL
jgi:hypothetical protein